MPARSLMLMLALSASLGATQAVATGASEGRALYESRCDACHDKSVHNRSTRKARNFGEIRHWVARWNAELGGAWKDDEIDAVTRYLNERYYRFPCPPAMCPTDRG